MGGRTGSDAEGCPWGTIVVFALRTVMTSFGLGR
jgi:hypothetical protein